MCPSYPSLQASSATATRRPESCHGADSSQVSIFSSASLSLRLISPRHRQSPNEPTESLAKKMPNQCSNACAQPYPEQDSTSSVEQTVFVATRSAIQFAHPNN